MSKTTAAEDNRTEKRCEELDLKRANREAVASQLPVFSPHGLRIFTSDEFGQLTDDYRHDNFLGETQFAKLYRGKMETCAVAVKIFTDSDSDSDSTTTKDKHSRYKDEIQLLTHPRIEGCHRSLAKLIGCCPECLGVVYDANPRDTLDNLIVSDNFTWLQRMKVALQLAHLLVFFHDYDPPFILCKLDAAQIMVDQDYDLVLFDFGMLVGGPFYNLISRAIPNGKIHERLGYRNLELIKFDNAEIPNGKINEHLGYVDLELLKFAGWSVTHDVSSYGVILLSLIAKRLFGFCWSENFVTLWAKKECREKIPWTDRERNALNAHEIFKEDPDYDVHDANKIMKLAMNCIELLPKDRPTMKEMLEFLQALRVVLLNGMGDTGKTEVFEILPSQLREITGAFSFDNLLGGTQFGKLYRGRMSHGANQNEARAVTVKIWDDSICDSAYQMEKWSKLIEEVYFLQHPRVNRHQLSLAKPIGYCRTNELLGIVFDVNPRDSLHNLILKDDFTWVQRIRVALKLAHLLVFFHNYDSPFIVRNISAAHFLVDQDYNPVLVDLGMLVGGFFGTSNSPNGKLHGAPGYIDLHYLTVGGWSITRDVFSYGVLLLNLFSKSVVDISKQETCAARWGKLRCKEEIHWLSNDKNFSRVNEIFKNDPDFSYFDAYKIMKLALNCIVYVPEDRPTIKQIYESLQALYVVQRTGMGEPRKSLLREFLPSQLSEFTRGYHIENFLGNTQFAKLYRARISDDADRIHAVTVKIWDETLCGRAEPLDQWSKMMDEVHLLRHHSVNGHQQNFAKPIGYSHNCQRPGVVYDLNPRDTLTKEILKDNFKWLQRIKVALQLARLLFFFHNYDPPYILRNISADHILIDKDYNPVLFDFGMMIGGLFGNARDVPKQRVYGADGYRDLSFWLDGQWFVKRDVFSFGVVLLSLFSKRVIDPTQPEEKFVVHWAKKNYREGMTKEEINKVFRHVHKNFKKDPGYTRDDGVRVARLALECVEHDIHIRPRTQVVLHRLMDLDAVMRFGREFGNSTSA
ncbi:hypothetical protein ACH5RR_022360 [Cinchona calisaya]|uniref:Protein kinase domain-containing protein n=1 Tax=Cinchona calisaya TaxID=153742 RepID=A0ABD2Z7L3_9GENT